MSKSKVFGSCSVCGDEFERRRPRQRKRLFCYLGEMFRCANPKCKQPYQRIDDVRLCAECVKTLEIPSTAEGWPHVLKMLGTGVLRGKFLGGQQLKSVSEAYGKVDPHTGEPIGRKGLTPDQHTQFIIDMGERHGEQLESDPESTLLSPSEFQLGITEKETIDWFLTAPVGTIAKTCKLHPEQVQRLRAEILDVDRTEVEAAKKALGYTAEDWQMLKLTNGLLTAKVKAALRNVGGL